MLAPLRDDKTVGHEGQACVTGVRCRGAARGMVIREDSRLVDEHALREVNGQRHLRAPAHRHGLIGKGAVG